MPTQVSSYNPSTHETKNVTIKVHNVASYINGMPFMSLDDIRSDAGLLSFINSIEREAPNKIANMIFKVVPLDYTLRKLGFE